MAGARATALSCFSLLLFCSYALVSPGSSDATVVDELALLSFKSMLSGPSDGLLASWNTSIHYCDWTGVVCSGRRQPERVVALLMNSSSLSGRISPFLGNLSFLNRLDLHGNGFIGQIPSELGHLSRLRVLNLSTNSLDGSIPVALGRCTNLTVLDLSSNKLRGKIPTEVGALENLVDLRLHKNGLSGEIPLHISNLLSVEYLYLRDNWFSGEIPPALGNLTKLRYLDLASNKLSGSIPSSLGQLSSLSLFNLGHNNLSGLIPNSIWNISSLTVLSVQVNMLSGTIPPNAFDSLPRLQSIAMDTNKFEGYIPASLANASNLSFVQLSVNEITGSIPKDIGNLISLQQIDLSNNYFIGTLPSSLSRLNKLQALSVYSNNISGLVPSTIGNLTEMNYLDLDSNAFSGSIPSTLGNMTNLLALGLSDNNFIGRIPIGILSIPTLSDILELSNNNLEGPIPQEIGNLKNLVEFHAYSNRLSGEIPSTLGECKLLRNLYLQNNDLTGSIPSLLSQLKGLENLDLSSNNLSGQVPKFFGNITMLYYLNLSFNSFVGDIPNFGVFANATAISIQGNDKLCGGIPDLHLPPCSSESGKRRHKFPLIPVVSLAATIFILSLISAFLFWRKPMRKLPSATSMQGYPLISYQQIVRATDGFSTTNLLGSGTFGTVFKGNISAQDGENTSLVAIKVLKLQTPGALKSFSAECEALRDLRHRNLVKIITVCSSIDNRGNDFKAIVLDFMSNGSLEGWLHPDKNDQTDQRYLSLLERVCVLLDVAYGLDYLHCHGPTPVVHCDLKSSNVLLDADMVAHVGDFGLAKILVEGSSMFQQSTSSMGFRGTIGYAAPEYGAGNMVSTNGDIYSYGILVLETVTGKKPAGSKFRQGLSLREYVKSGLDDEVMEIVDMRLCMDLTNGIPTGNDATYKRKVECIVLLLKLGMSCSQELPSSRSSTGDIVTELLAIKESLSGDEHKM
ncbi:hypothetical protein OsI_33040 [Oryza sativa Indica Group]|uniref:Receptor kinase-like protein Xa21 n=1 Tax=Oryza sativa subsp. indica TaxID=39946 RepID=B8BG60_ORYSI|nr:hypothetical protein OsI_33040 [Oryza sativa Indica Group]